MSSRAAKHASYQRAYYRRRHRGSFENRLIFILYKAKQRAKNKGLEFDLVPEDYEEQLICPLLGIPFKHDSSREDKGRSMSIDRLDPTRGYTKDNTWLISQRANMIKCDATLEEFETIARNWRAEVERRRYAKKE